MVVPPGIVMVTSPAMSTPSEVLAPMIVALGWSAMRRRPADGRKQSGAIPKPWFVLGFLALVGINSAITIDPTVRAAVVQLTAFLLTMALSAMGLGADFKKLVAAGPRPLLLGAVSTLFISGFSLVLVVLTR